MNDDRSRFNLNTVRDLLDGKPWSSDLRYIQETPSTNALAARLPPGTWTTGTTIFTDLQTAGRGRNGRTWNAPRGTSLLLSTLIAPRPAQRHNDVISIAALAVADAIRNETGTATSIKWPNDVLVGGRKVAGILLEWHRALGDERIVVGIGVNANLSSEDVADIGANAGSLLLETGRLVSRESLAAGLLASLEMWYRCLTREPDEAFEAWQGRLETVGADIDVSEREGSWSGKATGVQRDGGLIVEQPDGTRRVVYAADVSIRTRTHLHLP